MKLLAIQQHIQEKLGAYNHGVSTSDKRIHRISMEDVSI